MEDFFTSKMQKALDKVSKGLDHCTSPFTTYSLHQLQQIAVENAKLTETYRALHRTLSPQALLMDATQLLEAMKQRYGVGPRAHEVSLDAVWCSEMPFHSNFLSLTSAVHTKLEDCIAFRMSIQGFLEPLFEACHFEYKVVY